MQQLVWVHPREMSWPWQWQVTPRMSAEFVSIHKQQFVWLVSSARVHGGVLPDWKAKHMSVLSIISPARGFGARTSARIHCIFPPEDLPGPPNHLTC